MLAAMESSLRRILEPEVMDTPDEAEAYDRMDHGEVNRALVQRFVELGARGRILDVGTGPAHIPILVAAAIGDCSIEAIDAAHHMLAHGRRNVAREGFSHRIRLTLCDAKRLPFPDHSFDAVISNSIVHHIPEPSACFAEIARVVKRDGVILLRDLKRPFDRAELDHLVATHARDADDRQRGLFRDSLHAAFTLGEIRSLLAASGLPDLRIYANSDRHWTAERGR